MLWAAFILGLFGSMHCIGMCGPIALALPLDRKNYWTAGTGALTYNLGRTLTYALMGLLFGAIGQAFMLVGLQRWVSLGAGILLLLYVVLVYVLKKPLFRSWTLGLGRLKSALGKRFKRSSYSSLFSIGLLNGLLPCGFVYFALVGAIASSSVVEGGLYMALFGLGTAPALLGMSLFGAQLLNRFKIDINRYVPYLLVLFGVLFVLRGMALGIPYISPDILPGATAPSCCH
ncbi:MAG: sulfite exporter TauE/SafE family protein [Flavobacteriales bacterium]|nr:sulfite exporter TauE/SafE family protein [Flavobacteriales bacterium]NNK81141.1 sulfite exporter TauE/SafE family protein [Flavobacteriales bacterium]